MKAEGWYQDPYKIHEDRWFSDGSPTALVRDAGVDPLVRSIHHNSSPGADDLRREGDGQDFTQKAWDVIGGYIPPT